MAAGLHTTKDGTVVRVIITANGYLITYPDGMVVSV